MATALIGCDKSVIPSGNDLYLPISIITITQKNNCLSRDDDKVTIFSVNHFVLSPSAALSISLKQLRSLTSIKFLPCLTLGAICNILPIFFECLWVNMKYIIVTGGVISGLGKGIVASSLGLLLKGFNLQLTAVKIDPYINIDAGTFSPYEHGKYDRLGNRN